MLFRQLALAASAAAFVIVPEVSEADEGVFRALPIESSGEPPEYPAHALEQTVNVPCKQCRGKDTQLEMNFVVQDGQELVLNGFELYPNADMWHNDLVASVIKGDGKAKEDKLGYSLAVRPEAMDEDQHFELIGVELRVIEVGTRFVEGVPPVKVKLIKAPGGDIIIGSIDVEDTRDDPTKNCKTMMCRVKGVIDHAWKDIKGFKGCGGAKIHGGHKDHHDHGQGHQHKGSESQENYEFNHGKVEHQQDRPHHTGLQIAKNFTSYIFIPIFLGIAAGVGVAFIAMFITTLIVALTRLVKGKGRTETDEFPGFIVKADQVDSQVDEEKVGLMTEEDVPPQYQHEDSRN